MLTVHSGSGKATGKALGPGRAWGRGLEMQREGWQSRSLANYAGDNKGDPGLGDKGQRHSSEQRLGLSSAACLHLAFGFGRGTRVTGRRGGGVPGG